jgi:hypothetical protein
MRFRFIAALLALAVPLPAAAELGVSFYGLAHHLDRSRARAMGLDNEFIAGLGLRYRVPHSERLQWTFEAAAYHDSGRNTALVAGAGALWKVTPGWRLGGALVGFKSDTYNRGDPFIAPLPIAAYEFGSLTLNLTFIPKMSKVNDVTTIAAWLTWWL